MSMSLDGFVAGQSQTLDDPIGRGGMALHQWQFDAELPGHEVDARWTAALLRPRGAYVMGRNMFGPVRAPWLSYKDDWRGWWGEEPPYHAPVFVLTHHKHDPIEMESGTTFHFVTTGFETALALAREAGGGDVDVAGGASAVRQALASGELDELSLDIAPVLLGSGERIFDEDIRAELEPVEGRALTMGNAHPLPAHHVAAPALAVWLRGRSCDRVRHTMRQADLWGSIVTTHSTDSSGECWGTCRRTPSS